MRLRILHADFPSLRPGAPPPDPGDRFLQAINRIEQAQNQQHIELAEERKAARAPKSVTEKFPCAVAHFKRLAGVSDPRDLPPVHTELAKATKADKRLAVQQQVRLRVEERDALGPGIPMVTKTLVDTISNGEPGSETTTDDLTVGTHPYTCGHVQGPDCAKAQAVASACDKVMEGELNPSVPEHVMLTSTDARFPTSDWTARQMMRATSVILDVAQGDQHPHAVAFRRFAGTGHDKIINAINNMDEEDKIKCGNVHPATLREVQHNMVLCFEETVLGADPDPPRYDDVVAAVKRRRFEHLQQIPNRHKEQPTPKTRDAPSEETKRETLGDRVENKQPTDRSWLTLFQQSEKKLGALAKRAPANEKGNKCCLSWQLKGFCHENCPRADTHTTLVGTTKKKFNNFVQHELAPKQSTDQEKETGTPGTDESQDGLDKSS